MLCKSCCCCVQQRYGAWKTCRLITVVVQRDHVLISWMCVAYEKIDRGLHRHISLYGGTRTWGMFKQRQTGWAKQIVWLLVGDCMHCMHNKVTQFKSAWDKCTIWHTWNSLDVQEGKLWLRLVLFQTAEHLGSACSGQCPAESQAHHFPCCLDKEIQVTGPVPSQGF